MFNSLALGKFELNFRHVIFKQILVIDGWGISCEIALIWMSLDLTDDPSTLVEVMAWCRQATSHYLSQCWPRFMSLYGVTRPQWVNMEVNIVSTDDLAPLRTRASVSRVVSKFVSHIYTGPVLQGYLSILSHSNFSTTYCRGFFVLSECCLLEVITWLTFAVSMSDGGLSYLGLTRSISWLLMPWLLTSPGHQQPWYWLSRIGLFLSYLRNDFNYLCRINVEKWHKM